MKSCSKCHIEKDESEFYSQSSGRNGLYSSCKKCFNRQCVESRKKNDKHRQSRKRSNHKHKAKRYLYTKNWRSNNKEVVYEYHRNWHSKNGSKYQKSRRDSLTKSYLKSSLTKSGVSKEQIDEMPILLDKKRLDILIFRSHKLKKQKL